MVMWNIEYWADRAGKKAVESWLDRLTDEQLESVTKELNMLGRVGNMLKLPHSRSLGKGLFELRERRYGYRIYYGFYGKKMIILLAAGDKDTQKNDIKVARDRLANLIKK